MRVLICPDKFAGTLSASEVGEAIAEGWRDAAPADETAVRPLSDGGPGFLDVVAASLDCRRFAVETVDPLGRPVTGEVLLAGEGTAAGAGQASGASQALGGQAGTAAGAGQASGASQALGGQAGTGYVESAQACGLHLLAPGERDPKITTSYGLGALLAVAVETGARRIVVGLGGSATNDGGAGMLAALGAAPLDAAGYALPYGGAALAGVAALGGAPRLRGATLIAATDVDSPLTGPHGASNVFGPQKGASREDVLLLDAALGRFAGVLEKGLPGCPPGLVALPGGGAAGGIGAAILALGGRCESGIELVRRLSGLDAALDACDLVITGEGSFDHQSLRGKVVAGVAQAAQERGVPCLVVAGRASAGRREAAAVGISEVHSLVEHFGGEQRGGVDAAMTRPAEGLRELAGRLARQWSHS